MEKGQSFLPRPYFICICFCFFSEEMTRTRREMADELDYLEKQLTLLTNEIKDKIKSTVEDVERKVTAVWNGSLFYIDNFM